MNVPLIIASGLVVLLIPVGMIFVDEAYDARVFLIGSLLAITLFVLSCVK